MTWIRSYKVDGQERQDVTYRTPIVEHYVDIPGKTFLDVGAADGYESRAVAMKGAKHVLSIEAKDRPVELARAAKQTLQVSNQDIRQFDAREIHTLEPVDVTLCFGFLYHMQNPFNFLKRARAVTRELLLLETHVAPLTEEELGEKHRGAFAPGLHTVYLDGVPFDGRYRPHHGEHSASKGSVDEPWTFWLTPDSLLKAVMRAGFHVLDYHHEPDPIAPEPVRKFGEMLGFGKANTKVFIAAKPIGTAPNVTPTTISLYPDQIVPPSLPVQPWYSRFRRVLSA